MENTAGFVGIHARAVLLDQLRPAFHGHAEANGVPDTGLGQAWAVLALAESFQCIDDATFGRGHSGRHIRSAGVRLVKIEAGVVPASWAFSKSMRNFSAASYSSSASFFAE